MIQRRLFTAFSVLSLLACAATVVLWVRSYNTWDLIEWAGEDRLLRLETLGGRLHFQCAHAAPGQWVAGFFYVRSPFAQWGTWKDVMGFSVQRSPAGSPIDVLYLSMPLWFVTFIFASVPATWVFRRHRQRRVQNRRSENACISCGYSLNGNVSGICPECGTSTEREVRS